MKNTVIFTKELVREYADEKRFRELRELVLEYLPEDFALDLAILPRSERGFLFRLLPKEYAAECFVELSSDIQRELIEDFTENELSEILGEMFLDDTVDLIEEMPANVVKKILRSASSSDRVSINRLLGYPKGSAGSLMTPEYVRLLPNMSVSDALAHIRRVGLDSETVYTCYVTDRERKLLGTVSARQLLLADPDTPLSEIMTDTPVSAATHDSVEAVSALIKKYGLLALSVTDAEGRLVGIVTVDDVISVISEETEADFAKMAAITPSEKEYLQTSVLSIFRARIPWLLLLLVSAVLSSTMLSRFESALPSVLVLFVPMLMGTGGNCGSQASVTVIRALSLGTLAPKDAPRVLLKELSVGVLCAVALAAAAFLKVAFVDRYLSPSAEITFTVALTVAAALAVTTVVSKLIGAALPLLAKLVGLDPAVMASAFITTLIDALSLLVYFLIACSVIM